MRALVARLQQSGHAPPQLLFFAAAIGVSNGNATFHLDDTAHTQFHNWGSSMLLWQPGMENQTSDQDLVQKWVGQGWCTLKWVGG